MSASSQQIVAIARTVSGTIDADAHRENPEVTEALGAALAQALGGHTVDAVVLWNDPHTAVLGHVIAREIGAELIYAYADEGILTLSATPDANTRVAVVDFEWDHHPGLVPLLTMLRSTATVTAIASVLRPPASLREGDIAEAALISLAAPTPAESDTP